MASPARHSRTQAPILTSTDESTGDTANFEHERRLCIRIAKPDGEENSSWMTGKPEVFSDGRCKSKVIRCG